MRLTAFRSCAALVRYGRAHAKIEREPSAGAPGQALLGFVKTNGSRVYVVGGGTLQVIETSAGRPRLVGSLRLPGEGHELLVHGGRALVLAND